MINNGLYKTSIREYLKFTLKYKRYRAKCKNHAKILLNAHRQPTENHRIIIKIPHSFVPNIDWIIKVTLIRHKKWHVYAKDNQKSF